MCEQQIEDFAPQPEPDFGQRSSLSPPCSGGLQRTPERRRDSLLSDCHEQPQGLESAIGDECPFAPAYITGENSASTSLYQMATPVQLPTIPHLAQPTWPFEPPRKRGAGRPRKHPPKDPQAPKQKVGHPKGAKDQHKRLAKAAKASMTKAAHKEEVNTRRVKAKSNDQPR